MQHQDLFGPPTMPTAFWDHPDIRKAVRDRHIGRILRAYRTLQNPKITQMQLAEWLNIDQANLSRHERARRPTVRLDKLEQWARILRIPQRLLWFHVTPYANGASESPVATPTLAATTPASGDDVQRRQFLRATGALALGAPLMGNAPAGTNEQSTVAAEIRHMTAAFRASDNRYGGSHSRTALASYFDRAVKPVLTGRANPELCAAAAEMQHVAGWMAYDIGQPEMGRHHLREAVRLSKRAGDASLAAEMFAGMSHQAAFLGAADTAIDLALAAEHTAAPVDISSLTAEVNVLAAHGHAMKGERAECLHRLRESERAFERARGETPTWLAYFDDAYLAAKTAHVFRDLGVPTEAETYARRSLAMSEGYERGRLFNTALLASTLADQRRVEEACAEGGRAVAMLHQVRSVRATAYLSDLARRLSPFNTGDVRELYQQMHAVGVATPRM